MKKYRHILNKMQILKFKKKLQAVDQEKQPNRQNLKVVRDITEQRKC